MKNNYNSQIISIQEQKAIQLDMLKSIHLYCEQLGLSYFMIGGTLLGAVRHKGYIPWDDDIDIAMPRYDYEKLLEFCSSKPIGNNLSIQSFLNDKSTVYPMAKLVRNDTVVVENIAVKNKSGIWIDIFPLDNMPDDWAKARTMFKRIKFLRMLKELKIYNNENKKIKNALARPLQLLLKPFSLHRLLLLIDKKSRKYESKEMTKLVCFVVTGTYGEKEIMESEAFNQVVQLQFENDYFNAPKGWDYVLSRFYGDYMQLPPFEKRRSTHDYTVYWK